MAGKILALFHYFSTSQSDDFFFLLQWRDLNPCPSPHASQHCHCAKRLLDQSDEILILSYWKSYSSTWTLTIMRLKLKPMIMMTKVIMLIITAILLLYTVVLLQAEMPSVNVKCLKMHVRFFVLIFFSKKFILPE